MAAKIGLIGLGAIGLPLAETLIGKGLEVHGYRRSGMDDFARLGGKPAASPRAVAEACDAVVTVLPGHEAVREAIEGPKGLLAAGNKNLVIIELSTLALKHKEALAAAAARGGAVLLDSPLSGVPRMVRDRAAIIFASGDKAAYERAKFAFDGMSDRAFYLGAFGTGTKMKFVANALVGIHILAAAEAMALGMKAGLDKELMLKVLTPSAGGSLQFQVRAPVMARRSYEPVMAAHTVLGKDLLTIADFCDEMGCPTPLTHIARDYFKRALESDLRDTDVASVFELVAAESGLGK